MALAWVLRDPRMSVVEELKRMDADSDRCALELSDAHCDVLAYACLVAIMSQGANYHCESQARLGAVGQMAILPQHMCARDRRMAA